MQYSLEQGSSASQMTAAKVLDVVARLLKCAEQASDAVSGHTQVKIEVPPTLLKLLKSECLTMSKKRGQQTWHKIDEPVVPLERNLYGHQLSGLLWDGQFENVPLENGWEKAPTWECPVVYRQQRSLPGPCTWTTSNVRKETEILSPCGKYC